MVPGRTVPENANNAGFEHGNSPYGWRGGDQMTADRGIVKLQSVCRQQDLPRVGELQGTGLQKKCLQKHIFIETARE